MNARSTGRPRIVLMRPRNPDNLVTCTDVMRAFGLDDLVAVVDEAHFARMGEVLRTRRDGVVLGPVRRVDCLADAVADCSWVVGTTMRAPAGLPRWRSDQLGAELARRGDARWALVFGAESTGLLDVDVAQCHAVAFVPCEPEQPSLNLAQALVVFAHELTQVHVPDRGAPLVDDAGLRRLEAGLVGVMKGAGYARDGKGDAWTVDAVMATLRRGALTVEESRVFAALIHGAK